MVFCSKYQSRKPSFLTVYETVKSLTKMPSRSPLIIEDKNGQPSRRTLYFKAMDRILSGTL